MSIFSDIALNTLDTLLYASQRNWVLDVSPLKLCVKARQTGFSFAISHLPFAMFPSVV